MSDLFAKIFLDEDVSVVVASMLRSRHYAARTTLEAGRRGCTDNEQLEYAAVNGFVVLTHNRVDFDRLSLAYSAASKKHAGIIIAIRRSETELAGRLLLLLDQLAADEFHNQVFYI